MRIRDALPADLETILPLMHGYYRDDGLTFDIDSARKTLSRLLAEPHWGRVYLIEVDAHAIGYIAACIGFSLELGGNEAFIDEVFVLPEYRRRGHGSSALQLVIERCATLDIRALHLEVDADNAGAQRLYGSLGFHKRDRYYTMTRVFGDAATSSGQTKKI